MFTSLHTHMLFCFVLYDEHVLFLQSILLRKVNRRNILLLVWPLSFPTLTSSPIPTDVYPLQPLDLHALTCVNMDSPTVRRCKMPTS